MRTVILLAVAFLASGNAAAQQVGFYERAPQRSPFGVPKPPLIGNMNNKSQVNSDAVQSSLDSDFLQNDSPLSNGGDAAMMGTTGYGSIDRGDAAAQTDQTGYAEIDNLYARAMGAAPSASQLAQGTSAVQASGLSRRNLPRTTSRN